MQITKPRQIDLTPKDNREEILAMIRMIEFVRVNLPTAQKRSVEKYLHAAIEGLSDCIPRES